jgi:sarcosine oxidase delta subunit
MKLIQPLKERPSFFDGWETEKATYTFECPHCGSEEKIEFKEMLEAAWGWQERATEKKRKELAEVFKINLSDRNIGHGMKSVVESICSKCARPTYTFFWFQEYRHSCYDISLRASAIENTEQGGGGQLRSLRSLRATP